MKNRILSLLAAFCLLAGMLLVLSPRADARDDDSPTLVVTLPEGATEEMRQEMETAGVFSSPIPDREPAYSGSCGENVRWRLEDGILFISGRGDMQEYRAPKWIPWRGSLDEITRVVVEEGVTSLSPFALCDARFLSSVALPGSLTAIGEGAFLRCFSLEQIALPNALKSIGTRAFACCYALEQMTIPANVSEIGKDAFAYTFCLDGIAVSPRNKAFCSLDGVLFDAEVTTLIHYPNTRAGSYAVPDTVEVLADHAFSCVPGLEDITLPEGLVTIGPGCFGANALKSLVLPETAVGIWDYAFSGLSQLESVYLPRQLACIPTYLFRGCTALTEMELPGDLQVIGRRAFSGCSGLTELHFIGSAPKISPSAFDGVTASASYPEGAPSWEVSRLGSYGGSLKWHSREGGIPFGDVAYHGWYTDAVLWALETGITHAEKGDWFEPISDCTRAQLVAFLWRIAGSPDPGKVNNPFIDVWPTEWYYDPIQWAAHNGLVGGVGNDSFDPDGSCSRAQVVSILWRAQGCPVVDAENPFTDLEPDSWYTDAVLWAIDMGLTSGVTETEFSPYSRCSRAECIVFLYRLYSN